MRRLAGLHAVVTSATRGLGVGIAAGLRRRRCARHHRRRSTRRNWPPRAIALAAVLPMAAVEATRDATWDRTLAVNLTAPFLLMRALAPRLAERGGSLVNVSSHAGVMGFTDETAYCAAKFGIEGLTRAAALEWRGRPVSVNTVTPGTRIEPTGVTAAEFAAWPEERRAADVDPVALGPAFVLLATLRGHPSGCRFDLWRLCAAIARDGCDATAARLLDLAETVERAQS